MSIFDPNAARYHWLAAAETRRELTPHERTEMRRLKRTLGSKQARKRREAAQKAALWGWA